MERDGAEARRLFACFLLRAASGPDYDPCVAKRDEQVQFAVRLPASLLTRVRDHCMERFVEDALREKLQSVGREGDGEDD